MPRLPNGMFKRESRFDTRVRKGYRDRWVSLGADYDEACRKLRELHSNPISLSRMTVTEAAKKWVEQYVKQSRTAYGQKQTQSRLNRYLLPKLGVTLMDRMDAEQLRDYRAWLETHDISPTTVKHILGEVRCLLNWCVDAGYLLRSPFPKRIMPRLQERPPDRLNDEEVDAITRIEEPYGFTIRLALATGLRWGELMRAQRIHVENGVLIVSQTKSKKVRRVPLERDILREILNRVGKLVPFENSDHFNRAVRLRSGIQQFHVQQCRHTFACRYLERGGSLHALQQLLGHSSVVMTQHYARLDDEHVRREFERVMAR